MAQNAGFGTTAEPKSEMGTNRQLDGKRYAVREALSIGRPVLMSGRYASLWRRLIWRFPTSNAKDVPGTMFY